jgi:hypothetical protein
LRSPIEGAQFRRDVKLARKQPLSDVRGSESGAEPGVPFEVKTPNATLRSPIEGAQFRGWQAKAPAPLASHFSSTLAVLAVAGLDFAFEHGVNHDHVAAGDGHAGAPPDEARG